MANLDLLHNGTFDSNLTFSSDAPTTDDVFNLQHLLDIIKRQYEDYFLLALNIGALMTFVLDKCRARQGGWRVREAFLFVCCLNTPIASILGMFVACHKVRKISFYLIVSVGLFLMYQSYDFVADEDLSWWKVLGFINIGLAFLTSVCEC